MKRHRLKRKKTWYTTGRGDSSYVEDNHTDNHHQISLALFFTSPQALLEWIDAATTAATTPTTTASASASASGPRILISPTAEIYSLIMEASIFSNDLKEADHAAFLELLLYRMLQADAVATLAATPATAQTTVKRAKVRTETRKKETAPIPSKYHFQKVIQGFVHKSQMDRAEQLLDHLVQLYEQAASSSSHHSDHRWCPTYALAIVLRAWTEYLRLPWMASSLVERMATRAKQLSSHLRTLD